MPVVIAASFRRVTNAEGSMAPWVLEILDKRPEIALFAMFIALIAILVVVAIEAGQLI
jgi:hypothetical protein